jgi:hypothetical protein
MPHRVTFARRVSVTFVRTDLAGVTFATAKKPQLRVEHGYERNQNGSDIGPLILRVTGDGRRWLAEQ